MAEFAPTQSARPVDDWAPKRQLTLEAARAHSRRVRLFQLVLLGISGLLVLMLLFQFATRGSATLVETEIDETVRMVNPRYVGRTSDGLPYTLTADQATRVRDNPNELALNVPLLNFYRVVGAEASTIDAVDGIYNDVEQTLELRTDVILTTDDGNECTTAHARIFLDTKLVEGDEPIRCTGDFGVVNGNAFEIRDSYKTFVFKNGMNGLLENDPAEGQSALASGDGEL